MKKVFWFLAISGSFLAVAAVWFWVEFRTYHVRFRVTLEVKDGAQIKTGSSVLGLAYDTVPDSLALFNSSPVSNVTGFAPTVDLGGKGLLVMTFLSDERTPDQWRAYAATTRCRLDNMGCLPFAAYRLGSMVSSGSGKKADLAKLLEQHGRREVPFVVLPAFRQIPPNYVPDILTRVHLDDLAASLGPGVELLRVTLELTDDPVSGVPRSWPKRMAEDQSLVGVMRGSR